MRRLLISNLVFIVLACTLFSTRNILAIVCTRYKVTTADDAALVLGRLKPDATDSEDKSCIELAIWQVAQRHSNSDIELLLPYLSFTRDLTESEKNGFYLHPPSPHYRYPAVDALSMEGESARGPLLSVVINSSSQLARQNATRALLLNFQRESGKSAVDAINYMKAAGTTQVQNPSNNLSESIQFALTLSGCTKLKGQCEQALAH